MLKTLLPGELTVSFDPETLQFSDTAQLVSQDCGWIGQQRAEKAARFGLLLDQPGYNLFVLGSPGSGRSSLLFRAMQETAAHSPTAPDLVYLYNFDQPERPLALRLHTGQGAALHAALEHFSAHVAHDIPRKLHEEGYRLDCERLKKDHRLHIDRAYVELVAFATARHFALRRDDGRLVFTLQGEDGQAMQEETILALPAERRAALEDAEQGLRAEIGKYLELVRPIELDAERALTQLRRQTAEPVVQREIDALRDALAAQVADAAKFAGYLTHLAEDVLENLDVFSGENDADEAVEALLSRYRANLVVDNSGMQGAPALRDDDPVFRSLFGGVDYQVENGVLVTNFMHIRPGNLVRAHGGYLMLHLRDVLRDVAVWEKLQRYLRSGRLQIEEPAAASGQLAAKMLEPEALEVQVKLVLIGARADYYELQEADPEFARHFRVKVDFAEHFPADAGARHAVSVFIAQRCQALGLPHFSSAAVARLLLDMQREIDDQRRISAGFGYLEAMVVESAAYCKARAAEQVSAADVALALSERRARHDYPELALLDAIAEGEVMIHVQGQVVGQINGLTQIDLGDYRFGSPVRITAHAFAGDEGVLNIDREVEMSGPTHDKGVFILQGWLSARSRNSRRGRKLPLMYLTPASTMPFFCGSRGGQGSILNA